MENTNKKSVVIIKVLIVFLFVIFLFLLYINIRNIYNNVAFYLINESTINLGLNSNYQEPGFVAVMNGRNIKDKVQIKSNVDTSKYGTYEISYILEFKMLAIKKELKRKVIVKDLVKPELNVQSEDEIYLFLNEEYDMPAFNALDNIDGDITDKVEIDSNIDITQVGTYNITYSVIDSSNNEVKKNIKVIVDRKDKLSYLQVNISEQKLYYYEKNKLVLSTNIVTGMKGISETPTGTYSVLRKNRNVTLRGADYESFVNYWIAFKGNAYGFHDASWRSNFGGNIYRYNGSHGCVNMPYYKVQQLYNMIEVGTPVYINY
ncbi:MAG: DUF5011 domain-containing protein [Bacilli bacterium]|nr:DUF5011 domain-containing protein [Bacilli bacterium]